MLAMIGVSVRRREIIPLHEKVLYLCGNIEELANSLLVYAY